MGDIVNLNRFRKQKLREEKSRQAAMNRAKHGVSKAERERTRAERAQQLRQVDGHRLEGDTSGRPPDDGRPG